MRLESKDITDENIKKILDLFPNVATEAKDENGELRTAIDFDKLKQELSKDVVDGEECYDFTWVGKKEAMFEANRPIRKTLRPDRDSSVEWENTQNIYIEGDNLDALKLLQESYLGKIKMIYIDPPYNTGKDFVYRDNFHKNNEDNDKDINYKNDEAEINFSKSNELFLNTESNGRFHSDWCSMIYSRLKLARNLLSDDGVIFISIDDNEVRNLKNICDEIYGEINNIGLISTINNLKSRSDSEFFATCNEFLLVYAKNKFSALISGFDIEEEEVDKDYKFQDEISKWKPVGFRKTGNGWKREDRPYMYYPVLYKDGNFTTVSKEEYNKIYSTKNNEFDDNYVELLQKKYEELGYYFILPKDEKGAYGRWRWGVDTFFREKDINLTLNTSNTICTKMRATIEDGSVRIKSAKTLWYKPEYDTGSGTRVLKTLFNKKDLFDNPKSFTYIFDILKISVNKNDIILDFFSGSATTAHACMQLNAEDGGNRKFIMVQLPEKTDEKSEAFKAGYKNICEIGEERIRRAGKKIQEENPDKKIDVGFRVFKVDDTNMKDVYYSPNETNQKQLGLYESNIKDDRTDEDLLYGCLLDWGVELSLPHRVETIDGKRVHIVDEDALVACFEENIPESVIRKIAGMKPLRVVFRDSSFNSDDNKINVEEIFKLITPDTRVKVI